MTTPAAGLAAASPNFAFLSHYNRRLVEAAVAAERSVFIDPVGCLGHLRRFGEFLAQQAAATVGIYTDTRDNQLNILRSLADRQILTRDVANLFHDLRKTGNTASHQGIGSRREALHQLRMARTLAVWFHRTLGNKPKFKVGPFVPPPDPSEKDDLLKAELKRLRIDLEKAEAVAASSTDAAEKEAVRRAQAYEDLEAALHLAEQTEEQAAAAKVEWTLRLSALQTQAEAAPPAQLKAFVDRAQAAGDPEQLDLDEAATRKLIDAQLAAAGWKADTEAIAYKQGVRPTKGRNLAIAEWPTSSGPADYVLFVGLTAVGVVEAKRKRKDVAGAIAQAKRYSTDYVLKGNDKLAGGPWGNYRIPFLFATNGRPYLRQLKTKSGIWFLDARRSTNHPDALEGWYTPEGLKGLLAQDHDLAEANLKTEPTDYLGLRDYQLEAIRCAEVGVEEGKRELLLAMATGTGKTRTALGLMYRLIKAQRFRRILFLVDRSALGEQAENAFKNVKLENLQSINEIYDVKGLADLAPDEDTRLHVATVQGMVKRLLYPDDNDAPVPVDRYDCIIVDESHRGVGEEVATYNAGSSQVEMFNAPDEIDIEVDGFNTKVVTENFNRVVCEKLAEEIDPTLPGKTMIFCATDAHADMVVGLLKTAFTNAYGEVEDNAVMKITGAADKPLHKLRLFKNETLPNVAVTVDLLTTGIDVPKITNLVFIRRVRSRILYEQMLGRATRLCPDIGKECFRIYDAVDLYAALKDYSTMKPVVTRPKLTFTQLVEELVTVKDDTHCEAA